MLRGIDFSFGNGVTPAEIKAADFHFVCRYLTGLDGNPKDIDAKELAAYLAAKIPVVFVFETSGLEPDHAAGVADAQRAQAQLNELASQVSALTKAELKAAGIGFIGRLRLRFTAVNALTKATVFFAADSATPGHVVDYLKGVNSVIGVARTGEYGGINSITEAFNAGVTTYGWQTLAWSSGNWDDRALLRQFLGVRVGPADCDLDEAAFWNQAKVLTGKDDFGQFPTPVASRPVVQYITDGTKSLAAICATHTDNPHRVIMRTLKRGLHPKLLLYIARHPALRYPMPKGVRLYIAE